MQQQNLTDINTDQVFWYKSKSKSGFMTLMFKSSNKMKIIHFLCFFIFYFSSRIEGIILNVNKVKCLLDFL